MFERNDPTLKDEKRKQNLNEKEIYSIAKINKERNIVAKGQNLKARKKIDEKSTSNIADCRAWEKKFEIILSYEFKHLKAGTDYSINIAAINKVGHGKFSESSIPKITLPVIHPSSIERSPLIVYVKPTEVDIAW